MPHNIILIDMPVRIPEVKSRSDVSGRKRCIRIEIDRQTIPIRMAVRWLVPLGLLKNILRFLSTAR